MLARALTIVAVIGVTGAAVNRAAVPDPGVTRAALSELPFQIDDWNGQDSAPWPDDVIAKLGVDDYVNRHYVKDGRPIAVYVGYYGSQRSGDTIHSPQNCLPGAGWLAVDSGPQTIRLDDRSVSVARYEIAKGIDRQMVLYWYQGRGRIVSGEYANKAWLMLDAARYGRSNGGLVRLITPIVTTREAALADVSSFAAALLPRLSRHLP
ncbi:MAG TPA: EpsI family protein [Vicinamibacterales bacterium]|jgi:EpsI family protein